MAYLDLHYRRRVTVLGVLTFIFLCICGLVSFARPVSYDHYAQLKEYEGVYEYNNGMKLKVALSPQDSALYAIINQTRYRLTEDGNDSFRTGAAPVIFTRDNARHIAGYITTDGKHFRLLDKHVHFPEQMWYPRLSKNNKITPPEEINDGLRTGSLSASGLDTALLAEMTRKISDGTYPNVHSVLIIKDGKLVYEEYFYEYTRDSLQEMRSASKSVVSALTGIAIGQGIIKSKTDKVLPYFPEYKIANDAAIKGRITIENLLSNQSGLDCDISNGKSPGNETAMDYSDDWVKFTLELPMADTPGGKGMYCSGNPITLGRIVEKAAGMPLAQYAQKNLFNPLGINNYNWDFRPDKSNAENYCQLYLTPREMAKFGLLYLDKGKWNGRQVVPEQWVSESVQKHSVVQGVDYGYLWWLKYLDAGGVRYYSAGAQGNGGQKIYIWKEQNMVTVVTGGNYNSQSPSDELIRKYILAAFNKK